MMVKLFHPRFPSTLISAFLRLNDRHPNRMSLRGSNSRHSVLTCDKIIDNSSWPLSLCDVLLFSSIVEEKENIVDVKNE